MKVLYNVKTDFFTLKKSECKEDIYQEVLDFEYYKVLQDEKKRNVKF